MRPWHRSALLQAPQAQGGGGGGSSLTYIGSNEGIVISSPSLALPAEAASGDFVIAFGFDRASTATGRVTNAGATVLGAGPSSFFHASWLITDGSDITFDITSSGPVFMGCHVYRGPEDASGLTTAFGQFGTTSGWTATGGAQFPSLTDPGAGAFMGWAMTQTDDVTSAVTFTPTPDDSGWLDTTSGNDGTIAHAQLAGGGGDVSMLFAATGMPEAFFSEGMTYTLA